VSSEPGAAHLVIELITAFCGSPNVDSEKIVEIEETQGDYKIPLHEFTKHALLGDYAYYHPQSSLVACNIYDVTAPDPREHFLAGLIITFISAGDAAKDNDGYVDGRRIMAAMNSHSYTEDQVRYSLRRLAAKRLIETPYAQYRELEVPDNVPAESFYYRATSIGIYHVRFWMGTFSFLDATSTDTPIFDSATRGDVFELAGSFEILDRYKKSVVFRQYLEQQWHLANIAASYFDFSSMLRSQEQSFHAVEKFINRPKKESHKKKKSHKRKS
jgi:hypothetical protein